LEIEIPFPDIEEQEDIVQHLTRKKDNSLEISTELTHQLTLVKKLRQQLLQDAVQGKLVEQNKKDEPASELLKKIKAEKEKLIAEKKLKKEKELPPIKPEEIPFEIPENWVWCRLGEIGKITGGGTPSMGNDEYWNGDIPWVSPKDMWTEFVSDTEMKVTPKGIKESSTNLIPVGSLLIVGRSGILKRKLPVAINSVECTVNQDMKVIIPHIIKMNRFLQFMFWGLESTILKEYVKFGMTVHSLKYDEFSQMPIPLPPIKEQERIVQKVEELMQYCNDLETSINQSESQNEKLLQQVLREALRKEPVEV
jgi:type I restriction enzyme S subunit